MVAVNIFWFLEGLLAAAFNLRIESEVSGRAENDGHQMF